MNDWRTTSALLAGIAVLAAGAPTPARAQQEPEVLKRTTKWIARFDKDACHLVAQFGDGEDYVVAFFTRYKPDTYFDLNLVGERFRSKDPKVEVRIDFGIRSDQVQTATLGTMGGTPAVFLHSLRVDGFGQERPKDAVVTPEQEERVKGFVVRLGRKQPLRLETGSLGKSFATLRDCTSDLVKSWGYDPAVQDTLSRRAIARTPIHTWITRSDYPMSAIRDGDTGMVKFRLDIDAEGKIANCHILARTSPDEFGDTVCRRFTRRGAFEPALDAAGKPVLSYYVAGVRFDMP